MLELVPVDEAHLPEAYLRYYCTTYRRSGKRKKSSFTLCIEIGEHIAFARARRYQLLAYSLAASRGTHDSEHGVNIDVHFRCRFDFAGCGNSGGEWKYAGYDVSNDAGSEHVSKLCFPLTLIISLLYEYR